MDSMLGNFEFNEETGDLLLTNSFGEQVVEPIIDRFELDASHRFFVLDEGRAAYFVQDGILSAPYYENEESALRIFPCRDPHTFIHRYRIAMRQYTDFGLMDAKGMRLACAGIYYHKYLRADNPYEFKPWITSVKELKLVLHYLLTTPGACGPRARKTLLILDAINYGPSHWFTVEVSLQTPERPKILIVALPADEDVGAYCFRDAKIFDIHPNMQVYAGQFNIQRSPKGCAFFALYTAQHLQNIEAYLPGHIDLFEYLETHKLDKGSEGRLTACRLPLKLILPAQTSELWTTEVRTYSEAEQALQINKKGQAFSRALDQHVVWTYDPRSEGWKEQNHWIDHFRASIERQVKDLVERVSPSEVEMLEQHFRVPS